MRIDEAVSYMDSMGIRDSGARDGGSGVLQKEAPDILRGAGARLNSLGEIARRTTVRCDDMRTADRAVRRTECELMWEMAQLTTEMKLELPYINPAC